MRSILNGFLKNSNLIFLAAILTGLLFGEYATSIRDYAFPALVFIMFVSTTQITVRELTHLRNYGRDIFFIIVINYFFLSGLILLSNHFFVKDPDLHAGFVIMAAIPSAVAVLPLTHLLKGKVILALLGSASLYLVGLITAPLISLGFFQSKLDFSQIFSPLIQLILIPFLLSRIVLRWKPFERIKVHQDILVNLAFFLIIYVTIGMNRLTFMSRFDLLGLVASVAFLRTFVSGHFIDLVCRVVGIDRERRMTYVLFGSFKNLGLAATIGLLLFNERTAIPAAVTMPFEILFFIWFNYFQKRWG